jgi:hypothetical protein
MLNRRTTAFCGGLALLAGSACGQPITEAFDDVTLLVPAGWFIANNSQEPAPVDGWFQGIDSPRISSHSGAATSYVASNYQETQGTTGTETISTWLVLPTRTLRNGDVLRFWTRTVTPATTIYPDRMQVRRSTAGASTNVGTGPTEVGDFTTLLLDINPNYSQNLNPGPPSGNPPIVDGYPVNWAQYTLTMAGLPSGGVSGRLAFRYFVENAGINGVNSNFIGVDDLEYVPASGTPCYPDCNGDHALNVNDFVCFQSAFAAMNLSLADCNHDNTLNVNDFVCFQSSYAAGCSSL